MAQKKKNVKKKPAPRKTDARNKAPAKKMDKNLHDTIFAVVLIGIAICLTICLIVPDAGVLCRWIRDVLFGLLGWAGALVPVALVFYAVLMILRYEKILSKVLLSTGATVLLSAFINVCEDPDRLLVAGKSGVGECVSSLYVSGTNLNSGGVIGGAIAEPMTLLVGALISGIIIFTVMLIAFIFVTGLTFASFIGTPDERRAAREERDELKKAEAEEERKRRIEKKIRLTLPEYGDEEPPKRERKKKEISEVTDPASEADEFDEEDTKIPAFTTNLDDTPEIFDRAASPDLPPIPTEDKITKEDIAEATAEVTAEIAAEEAVQPERPYVYPEIDLLSKPKFIREDGIADYLRSTGEKLVETLRSFNVETRILHASHGPTVTRYELAPEQGVKISKITNLEADIALSLAAKSVRIEAPIPGKSAIGIEIPNQVQQTVSIRELIDTDEFRNAKSKVTAALGKDISGENVFVDIAKMPHLLIAGATGTGKSVCINSIIVSLLYKAKPDEVKLILVDPKMVEFSVYKGIPHLLIPVVTDPKKAAGALSWAVTEMLSRYQMFTEKGVRDFKGYNANLEEDEKPLPQIVIIIDELADLMMSSPKEVEDAVMRLAQMARAAGMHLIIATQRPSADVITGTIKANIPSRIALAVSSGVNSRIILDEMGAENLLGRGDMLFDPLGAPKARRVQGCFVSDSEVEAVVEALKQNNPTEYNKEILKQIEQAALAQQKGKKDGTSLSASGSGQTAESEAADDEMFDRAVEVVIESGQASTSMLQRRVGLGYARAARLIDYMEQRGIVGPYQGSKPRKVLMTKEEWMEAKMRAENPGTAMSDGGVPEEF